jgi:hypothetical protein
MAETISRSLVIPVGAILLIGANLTSASEVHAKAFSGKLGHQAPDHAVG